jgi:predicted TIM-barrel fold metal-dependent hydrolase/DNA-binding beta-propeller fold protein YncE
MSPLPNVQRRGGVLAVVALCALPTVLAAQPAPRADHHQHLFSPATASLISTPGAPVSPIQGRDLIALLDSAGIRRAVVLSMGYTWGSPSRSVENEYDKVRAENDWTSQQVSLYSGRLVGFCSFNPIRSYALDELERCAADPRLRAGLKLHFANSVVDLHDSAHVAQLRRVFSAANRHRMPIVVHLRSSISRRLPYGRTEATIFLNEILPSAPEVPVQIAHLAGAGGYDDPTTDQALAVFVEAVARGDPRVQHVYYDVTTAVGRGPTIRANQGALIARRLRELGIQRVLFGSDAAAAPNLPPREAWRLFTQLPLTQEELATIAGNVPPYLSAATPPSAIQSIVVAYSNGDSAAIVDGRTFRIVATVPALNAHELAVTKDGGHVYLGTTARVDSTSATIAVVDVGRRAVARRLRIGDCRGLHDVRLSRDDSLLWVACARVPAVLGVSTTTGEARERWTTGVEGGWMLTSTPDDRKLYVPNLEGASVSIIDRATGSVRTLSLGGAMLGAAVSPDGREAWVSNADSSVITVLDVRSDSVLARFQSGGRRPVRLKFTPDGARVVISHDGSRDVTVMDARTRGRRDGAMLATPNVLRVIQLDAAPKVLDVSSDGKRAVVSQPDARKIAIVDLDRGVVIAYVPVNGVPDGVGFIR